MNLDKILTLSTLLGSLTLSAQASAYISNEESALLIDQYNNKLLTIRVDRPDDSRYYTNYEIRENVDEVIDYYEQLDDDIAIDVFDKTVMLSGTVDNLNEKLFAETIVPAIPGVDNFVSKIEVEDRPGI